MSLATRCPACGTVFRVVQDQLKVSEGWVRCGRCAEVFNAAQRLFELDAGPPAEPSVQGVAALAPPAGEDVAPAAEAAADAAPALPVDAAPALPADAAPALPAEPVPAPVQDASRPAPDEAAAGSAAAPVAAEPMPEFVRRADLDARWQQPARRGLLAGAALLLAMLLGAQIVLHYRDQMAATWPATRPALQAACGMLGCRIEAPRSIHSLGVDSSGLLRLPDSAPDRPLYRLSLVLQNKAPTVVRMPAIELTLSDTQGHTVVRRVLTAAELGQPAEQLPAGGELALQATLDLGERRVAGYTIELFYP